MANTDARREALFWTVCLPARAVFAASASIAELRAVPVLQTLLALYMASWGAGLFVNFVRGASAPALRARLGGTRDGAEQLRLQDELYLLEHGAFGGRVWWQRHRLVHASLLLAYAVLTLARVPCAFGFAVVDVLYAAGVGALHYRVQCDA
jgi:hypothetical protein